MKALSCLFLGFVSFSAANAQSLHLVLHSPPGEWIGGGVDHDITYTASTAAMFNVELMNWPGAPGPNFVRFAMMEFPISTHFLTADFGTNQLGLALTPGTYLNAERASFASVGHGGLDIGFEHRGSNELTGSFVIHQVAFHDNGGNWFLDFFDASFSQITQGGNLALTGRVTYSTVPEPASVLAMGAGIAALALRRRRK